MRQTRPSRVWPLSASSTAGWEAPHFIAAVGGGGKRWGRVIVAFGAPAGYISDIFFFESDATSTNFRAVGRLLLDAAVVASVLHQRRWWDHDERECFAMNENVDSSCSRHRRRRHIDANGFGRRVDAGVQTRILVGGCGEAPSKFAAALIREDKAPSFRCRGKETNSYRVNEGGERSKNVCFCHPCPDHPFPQKEVL